MKKTICLVTSGLQFNGNSLQEKALGGSESAMIYMARELANLGNDVTVYCECDKPGIYDNVDYRHCHTFMEDEKAQFDVCIVSRFTHFLSKPLDSKMNILWIHDTGIENPDLAMTQVDKIFCLSDFQKNIFEERYGISANVFWNTTNGFDPSLIQPSVPYEQKKNHYIYASRPERGLVKLLTDIWPKIVANNPNAILHLCGYKNPTVDDTSSNHYTEFYNKVRNLISKSQNIIEHGQLTKSAYYNLLSNCSMMLYPCTFPEISCINAIEAQAAGCLVITSDGFALSDTIKSNTKVPCPMLLEKWHEDLDHLLNDSEYDAKFLELVEKYQGDVYESEVQKVKSEIDSYSWWNIAKSWDSKIDEMFIERSNNNKQAILDQLVYMSDLIAARDVSNDTYYDSLIKKSIADNNIEDTYIPRDQIGTFYTSRITTIIDIIKKFIPEFDYKIRVLDLGAHDGEITAQLLEKYYLYVSKLYAYDACLPALTVLEEKLKPTYEQIEIIHDNALNIAQHDLDVNCVIIGELLEHIEDTIDFLNKLMSIVKRKTVFIFTTPSGPWDNVEKNKPKIEHMHHFELNDIREIFKDANVTILNPHTKTVGRRGEPMAHWVYYITVEPGKIPTFYKPDYMDKFVKTRPYKKISASMIVKNEENNLARCIKSFYNIVDELIIVDTGSTDDTKQIAAKYTDKIYDYKWEEEDGLGDFSKARNYGLSKCSGDYILWMDADEELINGNLLPNMIFSDYYDSILVKQRHCIVYGDKNEYDPPYHDRLFKREGFYFRGVVHEYPTNDGSWVTKCLFQDMIFIAHYGTINRPVRNEKIEDRYFDLIVKNYNQYPDFVMAQYYYLGLLCSLVQKHGEIKHLEKIFELWYNKIVPTKDLWLLKNSANFLQGLYKALLVNGVSSLPIGDIHVRQYENERGDTMELYALSDNEFDLFVDVYSHKELTR